MSYRNYWQSKRMIPPVERFCQHMERIDHTEVYENNKEKKVMLKIMM